VALYRSTNAWHSATLTPAPPSSVQPVKVTALAGLAVIEKTRINTMNKLRIRNVRAIAPPKFWFLCTVISTEYYEK
jgi:hypothetical protein